VQNCVLCLTSVDENARIKQRFPNMYYKTFTYATARIFNSYGSKIYVLEENCILFEFKPSQLLPRNVLFLFNDAGNKYCTVCTHIIQLMDRIVSSIPQMSVSRGKY